MRVRIGLHTGEAERSGDGLRRHRRPPRLAHLPGRPRRAGAGLAGGVAPGSARRVATLGEFEFRGLREPERIFQLVADDLAGRVPAAPQRPPARAERLARVIADDSTLLREGLARLLEEAGIEVVGQARNADELMLKVRSYHPDVAIVDIRMPPTQTDEGIRAAREIRAKHPETGVLVLSQHVAHTYAVELLGESAEGLGYLLKDRVTDVERVHRRGRGASPRAARRSTRSSSRELVGRSRGDDPLAAAVAARARGARADGGGPLEPGDRRSGSSSRRAPSRST